MNTMAIFGPINDDYTHSYADIERNADCHMLDKSEWEQMTPKISFLSRKIFDLSKIRIEIFDIRTQHTDRKG